MKTRITAIVLACLCTVMLAGLGFLAAHAHTSGYLTLTLALGDTEKPIALSSILSEERATAQLAAASPVPPHKPHQ